LGANVDDDFVCRQNDNTTSSSNYPACSNKHFATFIFIGNNEVWQTGPKNCETCIIKIKISKITSQNANHRH
jgi:hypothetical protein